MGLFFRKRRKPVARDPTTKKLVESGVMSLQIDEGIGEAYKKHARFPFSFWSGVKYVLILSVLLWWLPTLGQMIAGYVGGRKTGSPWKAVLAAILPVGIIFAISFMSTNGILTDEIHYVTSLPAMAADSLAANIPIIAPYIEFVQVYLGAFIVALKSTFSVGLNGYLVTIIFAYIGGIVGQQAKREIVLKTGLVGTKRTISVGVPKETVMSNMRRSATWWGKHPEKLKEMQKIPVRTVAKKKPTKAAAPPRPRRKQKPVKQAAKETTPKRNLGKKGYDKSTVNKRLVERALSRYSKR
jgi:hypothetical protein